IQSFIAILMVPVLVFYFLNDFSMIRRVTGSLVPSKWHRIGKRILDDIDDSLGGYIRGQLLVCLLLGALAALGFWIINVPYFVLLGIIIGITDLIPYFGPII